ncbi:MAG TPA: ABC transporter ATP-binding protein, partial [Tissierellaceae bacterium]
MIKLARYLKPYWHMVLGVIIFTLINVFTQLYIPNLMGDIVDIGVLKGDIPYILQTGLKMLLVALVGSICMIIASYLSSKTAMSFGKDLRSDVFGKVERFSLAEINQLGTSSLITRTTNDINQLQQVTVMILRMMVRAPIMLIGGVIMAVSKNVELSKVFLVAAPVLIISIGIVGSIGFPFFKIIQKKVDNLNQVLREELTGVRVIRAFNKQNYEHERFNEANKDLTGSLLQVTRLMAVMRPLLNLILNFTSVAVLWYGSKLIDINHLEVGELLTFLQYVMQIMFSLVMVSVMFIMIPRAAASANRVNEVLDTENSVVDNDNLENAENLNGHIVFDNVSFKYENAENPVLCNISFEAKPGEVTAIIGGTGSGKSTLLKLIPRFYDVTDGKILLDGVDISKISQKDLRNKIALVPQTANLFSGTIIDNIRFGKEDATIEEVEKAIEIAQGKDFVESLEDGYNSLVSQGGTNFSGGQKQRLSIARALVRKPEIYIFDDSFSALDFKTDKKLRQALKSEITDKTMILVAQRVSTILDADNI